MTKIDSGEDPSSLPIRTINQSFGMRFQEIVNNFGEQSAIESEGAIFTYSDLNHRANVVARCLMEFSQSDRPIALLLGNNEKMICSMVASWKLNQIFLSLDPSYPEERLDYILKDSTAELIITDRSYHGLAEKLSGDACRVVDIDELDFGAAAENILITGDGSSGAVLIYTSGSTGKPKGILHSHQNWLHAVKSGTFSYLNINSNDRYTLLHSCSFSAGLSDILNSLLNGAALCIWDMKVKGDAGLSRWIDDQGITIFNQSPSLFRHLARDFEKGVRWDSLRGLFLGSEPVTRIDFEIFKKYFSKDCLFVNRLGTTESLGYQVAILNSDSIVEVETIPTDLSINGSKVEIDSQTKSSDGVGEILIHGDYLAIGYWNKPEETSRSFVVDSTTGSRYYKTGDVGRFDEKGRLHFLGRNDFQIQIRGHRVEVAEIENALNECPGISDNAVVEGKGQKGEPILVAFCESKGSGFNVESLSVDLRKRLPDYMMPSVIAKIDELPKTPSGKLDRRALLDFEYSESMKSIVEPSTSAEKYLVDIWKKVFELESVSVTDNFFSLGGHSLLAFRVLSMIRQELGVTIPVGSFYSAPTLADLAKMIFDTKRDRKLPVGLNEQNKSNVAEYVPASFAQKRLWLLSRLEESHRHYHLPQAFRITGNLNIEALREAFIDLIERHEALRTVIFQKDDQVFQRILDANERAFSFVDLSELASEDKDEQVARTIEATVGKSFDLASDLMIRAVLIKTRVDDFILAWCLHHISGDGWSLMLIRRELNRLYEAKISESPILNEDFPTRYSEYSLAQADSLESPEMARQIDYWVNELKGIPDLLELPLKGPRPPVQSFDGAEYRTKINAEIFASIKKCCQERKTTLFTYMMACYQVLLHRYSGQSDIVVGTPIAGRYDEKLEDTIGFFVNTLALRGNLSGEARFDEFLSQIHQKAIEAFDHQSAPFELIVERINPNRSLGYTPVFQTMLALQNAPSVDLKFSNTKVSRMPIDLGASKFDITVNLIEQDDCLYLRVEYSNNLFDIPVMERMMNDFIGLASIFAQNVSAPIGAVPLVSEKEIIEGIAERASPVTHDSETVSCIFQQQVRDSSNSIAVVFEGESYTYGELRSRVNHLARELYLNDVREGSGVAIFLNRSIDMVVGLLATFELGSYFVPLDPALPDGRLQYMIEQAEVMCYLTSSDLVSRVGSSIPTVLVDRVDFESVDGHVEISVPHRRSSSLAYVIFTSGSTGNPKGVAISQGALLNLLRSMQEQPGIGKKDTLLAITTFSFDISILELLLPLITGSKLAIARREDVLDGRRLQRKLEELKATIMQGTPATWQLLLEAGWNGKPRIKVLCGGEAMDLNLKRSLLETGCEVWNLYGPTETTIWSAVERLDDCLSFPTIGEPVLNTELHVRNEFLRIQPLGVWGELYIGGIGLAEGYVNQKELTKRAFIQHPEKPNQRLYKTGDRVRRLNYGRFQYDGRLDSQVKVRGFRIELGEIESALDLHESVERSVVLVKQDKLGQGNLVAYIKPKSKTYENTSELRSWLDTRLPSYMVPASWLFVDQFPLTPNGKVDRKALAEFELNESPSHIARKPRTSTERDLAKIWGEMLGIKHPSIADNFFEIGGHSMLAAAMFGKIESEMNISLPLSALFRAPTIETLAAYIDGELVDDQWNVLVPIQPKGTKPPLFLIHGAEGNVLLYREISYMLDGDCPVYGIQAQGLDGVSDYNETIEEMASLYIRKIREVWPEGPYRLGGYCLGGTIAFEMGRKLREAGQEVEFVGLFETYNVSVVRNKSYLRRLCNKCLNVYFHLASFFSLPQSEQRKFFVNKFQVEKSRLKVRFNYFLNKWTPGKSPGRELAYQHLKIKEANDLAQVRFEPKPYSGNVTIFNSKTNFVGFNDPYCGWREIVEGDLEVCVLPIYPKAMLTPPFTRYLADELRDSLERSEKSLAVESV